MHDSGDDQALMREYLLGELDERQREEVEDRLLCDDAFADRLSAAQDSLIDDYVFETLSDRQREMFESTFMLNDERRKKLLISLSLKRYVEQDAMYAIAPDEPSDPSRWLRNTFQSLEAYKIWIVFSLVAALLLVFVVPKIGKLLKEKDQLAASQAQRARIERVIAELNRQRPDTLTEANRTIKLDIEPNLLREGAETQMAVITEDVKVLSLRLGLRLRRHETYRALVMTDESNELFAVSDLTRDVDETAILLKIPVEFLPTGDYQVELSGIVPDGGTEDVGRYQFRVIKKSVQN